MNLPYFQTNEFFFLTHFLSDSFCLPLEETKMTWQFDFAHGVSTRSFICVANENVAWVEQGLTIRFDVSVYPGPSPPITHRTDNNLLKNLIVWSTYFICPSFPFGVYMDRRILRFT